LDKQTSGAVIDANVSPAWAEGYTGAGVTIGIVDQTSFDYTNADLAPNYNPNLSQDFGGDGFNIFETPHSTACAGVAAACGGNGIGITGAAPQANLAALSVGDINGQAAAFQYRNDAIKIKSSSVTPIVPEFQATPQLTSAIDNAAAAGCIVVQCAQNFRNGMSVAGNVDGWGFAATPNAIIVGGVAADGKFASYSNWGSNLTVSAPTGVLNPVAPPSSIEQFGITTTGYQGQYGGFPDSNYTSLFHGTSAATPLVAGVLALAAQAQPNLNVRFAKQLLAHTSQMVDPTDSSPTGGWTTNGAGIHFNNDYGFGVIDAKALVDAARQYSGVTPQVKQSTGTIPVGKTVPLGDPQGLVQTFTLSDTGPLEDVQLTLDIYGAGGAADSFDLISPFGTDSFIWGRQLVTSSPTSYGETTWTFISNAFWGEDPAGTWELKIVNDRANDPNGVSLCQLVGLSVTTDSGQLIPVPEPSALALIVVAAIAGLAFWRRRLSPPGRI
jgi:kexin